MTERRDPPASAAAAADEALVRTFKAEPEARTGKRAADELLCRYSQRAYGWCFRLVRDHELALDLAQDALLSAYRALPRFREDARFSSWLFAIVRNRCLSHLRAPALLEDEVNPDDLASPQKGPAQGLEEQEDMTRLLAVMARTLTSTEQEALWLRCFERLPVDEITRVLKLSGAAGARGLLQTARRKLRAALADGAREGYG